LGAPGPAVDCAQNGAHPLTKLTNPANRTRILTRLRKFRPFAIHALLCTDPAGW